MSTIYRDKTKASKAAALRTDRTGRMHWAVADGDAFCITDRDPNKTVEDKNADRQTKLSNMSDVIIAASVLSAGHLMRMATRIGAGR